MALAVAVNAVAALGLLAGAGGTTPARAQAPSIEIVSFSAVSKLPDGIEFNANVTGDVEEVTARFTIQGRRATQYDHLDFADSG